MSAERRVALVTGASRGIGQAIAEGLAAEGIAVACLARKAENAHATRDRIREAGGEAEAFGADIANAEQVQAAIAEIEAQMGPITILVNNAGLTRDTLMMRMDLADWQAVIDANLTGAFHTIKACQRGMMKARWGRIVNISSIVGLGGAAGQTNYAASKAGLIGLTMAVAKELGSRNITCNAVAPGFIETDMTHELPADFRDHVVKTAPLGRLGSPQDIAAAVVFLCSDGASYMTGQTLVVDGGLTL